MRDEGKIYYYSPEYFERFLPERPKEITVLSKDQERYMDHITGNRSLRELEEAADELAREWKERDDKRELEKKKVVEERQRREIVEKEEARQKALKKKIEREKLEQIKRIKKQIRDGQIRRIRIR